MSDTVESVEITPAQARVLAFIRENVAYYSPTVREIAAGIGVRSPHSVTQHLDKLEEKGLIERTPRSPRGIRLVEAVKVEVTP